MSTPVSNNSSGAITYNVSQISEGKAFKNENLILKINIIMKTKMSNYRNCFALAYVLLVAGLSSCGNEQPILNGEKPFIVKEIKEFNKTHASYYNEWNDESGTKNNFFGSWTSRIVLPKGYYNIGDTIVISKPCH